MSKLEKKQKLKIVEIKYTPTPDDTRLRRVFDILLSPESSESLKSDCEDSHHSAADTGGKKDE